MTCCEELLIDAPLVFCLCRPPPCVPSPAAVGTNSGAWPHNTGPAHISGRACCAARACVCYRVLLLVYNVRVALHAPTSASCVARVFSTDVTGFARAKLLCGPPHAYTPCLRGRTPIVCGAWAPDALRAGLGPASCTTKLADRRSSQWAPSRTTHLKGVASAPAALLGCCLGLARSPAPRQALALIAIATR